MSHPERIVYVSSDDFAAASEKQFVGFAQELLRRGHAVLFAVGGDPDSALREGVDAIDGLEWIKYGFKGPRLDDATAVAIDRFRPDVVHSLSSRVPPLPAARQMARRSGAKLFVHFADDEWGSERELEWEGLKKRVSLTIRRRFWALNPSMWWLSTPTTLRWTRRDAAGLDALTPELAREVERQVGRACSVVLPVTPDLVAPPTEPGEPFDFGPDPVLLFTGSVWPVYLPDFMVGVRAVGELQRRGRRVTFVHAGRFHPIMDPAGLLREAGVAEGTAHLLGHLPFHRMDPLQRAATVLMQPGPPNRFNRLRLPSKMQAYLQSGVPTVTFAVGFGELLEDRVEVLKTHGHDPAELADRIEELLDDPELYARLQAGGPAAAARLFDPLANTDALLGVYRGTAG